MSGVRPEGICLVMKNVEDVLRFRGSGEQEIDWD